MVNEMTQSSETKISFCGQPLPAKELTLQGVLQQLPRFVALGVNGCFPSATTSACISGVRHAIVELCGTIVTWLENREYIFRQHFIM